MKDYSDVVRMIAKQDPETVDRSFLLKLKREYAKKHQMSDIPSNTALLRAYHALLKDKVMEPSLLVE